MRSSRKYRVKLKSPRPGIRDVAVSLQMPRLVVVVVLVLRAHWTLDVISGVMAAVLVAFICPKVAIWCDSLLAQLTGTGILG